MSEPCACTTVRKANRSLFRFYEQAMAGSGVSVTQFSILRALERGGPTPLSRLADELVMERTSLYRTIAPLEQAGALTIAPAEAGKAKIAALTAAGRKLSKDAAPYWEKAQSAVVSALGKETWSKLAAVLLDIPNLVEEQKWPLAPR